MTQPWKHRMLRRVGAFVLAAVVMMLLGSAAHSYFVQQAWSSAAGQAYATAPTAIPFADRISWAAHDVIGLFPTYCAVTSLALLVAFLMAGALARLTGFRIVVFGIAGAMALFVLFTIMRSVLGTVGIFGARGPTGMAGQMLAGAIAGVLFARLTEPSKLALRPMIRAT